MIRPYKHSDFSEILEIEQSVFSQYDAYFMMEMCQWCKDSIFVSEHSGHVIGYIIGVLTEEGEGRIFSVGVDILYQGLGIGSQLIRILMHKFLENGISDVVLEVRSSNMAAQRLYKRFGFRLYDVQKGYYDDDEDAVVMRTKISATNITS